MCCAYYRKAIHLDGSLCTSFVVFNSPSPYKKEVEVVVGVVEIVEAFEVVGVVAVVML